MSKAKYTVRYTTSAPATLTPADVKAVGYTGDHLSAELTFAVGETGCTYRLEVVDGGGRYDITAPLTPNEQGEVVFAVPSEWTAPGTATVRLVEYDGERVSHFSPVSLFFADRDEGPLVEHRRPRFEQLLEGAEQAIERVESATETLEQAGMLADLAKETADEALAAAKEAETRADSVTGVYIGSGEMPQGYAVQIDPNGTVLTKEDLMPLPFRVLYDGDPTAASGHAYTAPVTLVNGLTDFYDYRLFKAWVGDDGVDDQATTAVTLTVDAPLLRTGGSLSATVVDRYGDRFYLNLTYNENGQLLCNGTRTDQSGVSYTQGLYRLVGVM